MSNEIKFWRPQTWSDFIGTQNSGCIERLQRSVATHTPPPPLLLVGPYGCAKTALARHIIKAHCCPHVTENGNPCNAPGCEACIRQGPDYNGEGDVYEHYEFDCTRFTAKADVVERLRYVLSAHRPAVFWDEFGALNANAMKLLLTAVNDFSGIFIAAMTDEDLAKRTIPPPLFDRLRKVYLTIPTSGELVDFFITKAAGWGVAVDEATVRLMVNASQRSFRTCLDILQAARENTPPILDRDTLEEFLTIDPDVAWTPGAPFVPENDDWTQ